jgi:hypothetical protein
VGEPWPKPEKVEKPPRPLQRGKPIARAKRLPRRRKKTVGVPKYLRPEYRKWREELFELKGRICLLRYPCCTYEAKTIQHHKYGKGRSWKRLIVPPEDADPACWECHAVEDPWLLKPGFGLGSRERNARAEAA